LRFQNSLIVKQYVQPQSMKRQKALKEKLTSCTCQSVDLLVEYNIDISFHSNHRKTLRECAQSIKYVETPKAPIKDFKERARSLIFLHQSLCNTNGPFGKRSI